MMPSDNLMLIERNESRDITEAFTWLYFVGGDEILGKRIKDILVTDFYRHPIAVMFADGSYTVLCPDDVGESLSITICNELIEQGLEKGYIGGESVLSQLTSEYEYDVHGKEITSLDFHKSERPPCIFLGQVAISCIGLGDGKKLIIKYLYDCGYMVDGTIEG